MRHARVGIVVALAVIAALTGAAPVATATGANAESFRQQLIDGGRVSGVVAVRPKAGAPRGPMHVRNCTVPGGGNYITNCHSFGNPVNEMSIARRGNLFVAGANDYNSYNGDAQLGFYVSRGGKTWNDAGPPPIFPRDPNNASGDPGLGIDDAGVVYYSGIFFSRTQVNVGGVVLARLDPATRTWSYHQIADNSATHFQDKPSVSVGPENVFVAWTDFGPSNSPIRVAVSPLGPTAVPPTAILNVPGSVNSQGASVAADEDGGFFVSWEEFGASNQIKLAHFTPGTGWSAPQLISPPSFTDLPSPLPGFAFRNNSFPMMTVVNGAPVVVWASFDTGTGRTFVWDNGALFAPSNSGDDHFFPSVAPDAAGGYAVTWSQTDRAAQSYDQYQWHLNTVTKVSTSPSFPNSECFFGGSFIGDYNAIVVQGTTPHPIWTDVRRPSPVCAGRAQDGMVSSP